MNVTEMTLIRAMIESTLFGDANEVKWGICPWPLTQYQVIREARTYPVKFTEDEANRAFEALLRSGFIFQVQNWPGDENNRDIKYYPSYDNRSLAKLGIDDERLGRYMAQCRSELHGAFLSNWRVYGYDIRRGLKEPAQGMQQEMNGWS